MSTPRYVSSESAMDSRNRKYQAMYDRVAPGYHVAKRLYRLGFAHAGRPSG